MSNFDDLRDHVREARDAMAKVGPPTPENDNSLYYPLLFITETVDALLRHTLREAFDAVTDENRGAARFISEARTAVTQQAPRAGE